jgi:hypothetical protein
LLAIFVGSLLIALIPALSTALPQFWGLIA